MRGRSGAPGAGRKSGSKKQESGALKKPCTAWLNRRGRAVDAGETTSACFGAGIRGTWASGRERRFRPVLRTGHHPRTLGAYIRRQVDRPGSRRRFSFIPTGLSSRRGEKTRLTLLYSGSRTATRERRGAVAARHVRRPRVDGLDHAAPRRPPRTTWLSEIEAGHVGPPCSSCAPPPKIVRADAGVPTPEKPRAAQPRPLISRPLVNARAHKDRVPGGGRGGVQVFSGGRSEGRGNGGKKPWRPGPVGLAFDPGEWMGPRTAAGAGRGPGGRGHAFLFFSFLVFERTGEREHGARGLPVAWPKGRA